MPFRKDINGLRAIAVIAVVLLHFNKTWMPGGFAGVDVFFVISGFLMTRIIFTGLAQGDFAVLKFYGARATRIIPALAVLCLVLLAFGWWWLLDDQYYTLAHHSLGSMTFLSNILYWQEAGYFAASAQEKWLLHSWSLSAEWQFYLLYPLLLVFMARFMSLPQMKILITVATVLGFVFCAVITYRWDEAAYYLLPTRIWELTLGGVAYLYPINLKKHAQRGLQWLGLLMIVASYFLLNQHHLWPGYWAFFPVMGAFLVIQAQVDDNVITANPVLQNIGKWSYSIYLWHWPVVVLSHHYLAVDDLTNLAGIVISLLLGFISYRFIESKIRRLKTTLGLAAVAIMLSVVVLSQQGHFSFRTASQDPKNQIIAQYQDYKMDPAGWFKDCNAKIQFTHHGVFAVKNRCVDNQDVQGGVFFWGDSHVAAMAPGIRQFMPPQLLTYQLTSSGCGPSFVIKKGGSSIFDKACHYSNDLAFKVIKKIKPNVVVMGMRRAHQSMDWLQTIDTLKSFGVDKIIVLGPVPQWTPSLPAVYVKRHMGEQVIADRGFIRHLLQTNQIMKAKLAGIDRVSYIDILGALCSFDGKQPQCKVKVGDTLMAFDYGHLTGVGAGYIAHHLIINSMNYWHTPAP